jgi:hypothetical protein
MDMNQVLSEEDVGVPTVDELPPPYYLTPPSNPPKVELVISFNALIGFSAHQNVKIINYLKNRKVIILVDSGNTQNIIHHHISQ